MSNITALRGDCLAPFFDAQSFTGGGYLDGRFCQAVDDVVCCLPCPLTDWAYPDSFVSIGTATDSISVLSLVGCLWLLASWAFLPVEQTGRHYLTISLAIATVIFSFGFVIPLAAKPDQCFDAITPFSMSSSSVCAASGSALILGSWAAVFWVFLRSISLNLQICWQFAVGRTFMWTAQVLGWGLPILGLVLALALSGLSYRLGTTCHINHNNSVAVLWTPMIVFSSLTLLIQLATFAYCVKVYLSSLSDNAVTTVMDTNLPSYTNSIMTMTPRQTYRRVRRVIQLQWRGVLVVLIIVSEVIFFSVVFITQDHTVQKVATDPTLSADWVNCLIENPNNKSACLDKASSLVVTEAAVGTALIFLSMNGLLLLLLNGRWSMVTAWYELATTKRDDRARATKRRDGPHVGFSLPDPRLEDLKAAEHLRSMEMLPWDKAKPITMEDSVGPSPVGPSPISPFAHKPLPQPPLVASTTTTTTPTTSRRKASGYSLDHDSTAGREVTSVRDFTAASPYSAPPAAYASQANIGFTLDMAGMPNMVIQPSPSPPAGGAVGFDPSPSGRSSPDYFDRSPGSRSRQMHGPGATTSNANEAVAGPGAGVWELPTPGAPGKPATPRSAQELDGSQGAILHRQHELDGGYDASMHRQPHSELDGDYGANFQYQQLQQHNELDGDYGGRSEPPRHSETDGGYGGADSPHRLRNNHWPQ